MTKAEAFYAAAIIACGVTAAIRVQGFRVRVGNITALAMVAMWFLGRLIYALTGEGTPIRFMLVQDAAVIASMFIKNEWVDCPYRSLTHQLACLWHERTPWDKAILALFPVAWFFYARVLNPSHQYWTLWGIGLLQLALAGLEAIHFRQRAKAKSLHADAPGQPPGTLFAPVWGRLNAQ